MKDVWRDTGIGIFLLAIGLGISSLHGALWLQIGIVSAIALVGLLCVWASVRSEKLKPEPTTQRAKRQNVTDRGSTGPRNAAPIQIFLPQWNGQKEGDFYRDGRVQWSGFEQARAEADKFPGALQIEYNPVFQDTPADDLLRAMRASHQQGARYFIMTMSGVVERVVEKFKTWHRECLADENCGSGNAPALIVTVASAPKLCDATNGIVRWYIRSEEESTDLANRLEQLSHAAAVFAITQTPDRSDSLYGLKGTELFCHAFDRSIGPEFKFFVTASTAEAAVETFMATCIERGATQAWPGVFVVGYGEMVRNTITALLDRGYAGNIACSSTLTEPERQPSRTIVSATKANIFTVLPKVINKSRDPFFGDNRSMIFFFARKTLLRVLRLTANETDVGSFLERWKTDQSEEDLLQDYLQDGDIRVWLRVVHLSEILQ